MDGIAVIMAKEQAEAAAGLQTEGSRVSADRNTQEPLRLMFELPQNIIYAHRTFSILVPDGNGGVLEMIGDRRIFVLLIQLFVRIIDTAHIHFLIVDFYMG